MSRIRLVVPITPRRAWGNGKMTPGTKFTAASPVVRIGSSGFSSELIKGRI